MTHRINISRQRHWRLILALVAHRVEARLGRDLTDEELNRLPIGNTDPLAIRAIWLRYGGRLERRDGRLKLSKELAK